ncbi:MAG: hypothetical protein JRF40_08990 [Deltaproteobacteria bacterium]|nr:hypothetical protein [Deltaproteobacteria bacterium]
MTLAIQVGKKVLGSIVLLAEYKPIQLVIRDDLRFGSTNDQAKQFGQLAHFPSFIVLMISSGPYAGKGNAFVRRSLILARPGLL